MESTRLEEIEEVLRDLEGVTWPTAIAMAATSLRAAIRTYLAETAEVRQ